MSRSRECSLCHQKNGELVRDANWPWLCPRCKERHGTPESAEPAGEQVAAQEGGYYTHCPKCKGVTLHENSVCLVCNFCNAEPAAAPFDIEKARIRSPEQVSLDIGEAVVESGIGTGVWGSTRDRMRQAAEIEASEWEAAYKHLHAAFAEQQRTIAELRENVAELRAKWEQGERNIATLRAQLFAESEKNKAQSQRIQELRQELDHAYTESEEYCARLKHAGERIQELEAVVRDFVRAAKARLVLDSGAKGMGRNIAVEEAALLASLVRKYDVELAGKEGKHD